MVANAENAAGGSGLTPAIYHELLAAGVDCITLGDHIYRRREIFRILQTEPHIVKPANYPPDAPGRELAVCGRGNGVRVAVFSLLGRVFMPPVDCPFQAADRVLAELPADVRVILLDFHAEATSDKQLMGRHLDGRVTAVLGTHTHVPTADEQILPGGTAFQCDVGMTGPHDSILGRRIDRVLETTRTFRPRISRSPPATCGCTARWSSRCRYRQGHQHPPDLIEEAGAARLAMVHRSTTVPAPAPARRRGKEVALQQIGLAVHITSRYPPQPFDQRDGRNLDISAEAYRMAPPGGGGRSDWTVDAAGGARCLVPDPRGLGTHQQLGLPPCTFRVLFGRPCPACGMTTAWANVLRGRLPPALRANVTGTLLCGLDLAAVGWLGFRSCAVDGWAGRPTATPAPGWPPPLRP